MSISPPPTESDSGSIERITDLRDLRRGDRVVFGDRSKPVDVVDLGVRTKGDKRIGEEIETPLIRVKGDWDGAVTRVLAHKLNRYDDGPVLEEKDEIVACESMALERGEVVTVRRVERSEEGVSA